MSGRGQNLSLSDRFGQISNKTTRGGRGGGRGRGRGARGNAGTTSRRILSNAISSNRRFSTVMSQRTGTRVDANPTSAISRTRRGGRGRGRGQFRRGGARPTAPRSRNENNQQGGRGGRGRGRGGRGRGGRGRGRGGKLSKETLDMELDGYWEQNSESAKQRLDDDLADYFNSNQNNNATAATTTQ